MAGNNQQVMRVQLNLYAGKLKNVAGFGKGTSDPFAVLTLLASDPSQKPKILGKTEVIKNSLSPKWTTSFTVEYRLGMNTRINIGIFDEIRKGNEARPMGSAMFEVGEVLGARGNVKAKKLKPGGTLFVHAMRAPEASSGKLHLKLHGYHLKNVEGFFGGKSDPFYEISGKVESAGGLSWQPVYRSKQVTNNLNPAWEEATMSLNQLCRGDIDAPVLIAVFDWEKSGKHRAMGSFETSVNGLTHSVVPTPSGNNANLAQAFTLKRKGKEYGKILVTGARVTGASHTHNYPAAGTPSSGMTAEPPASSVAPNNHNNAPPAAREANPFSAALANPRPQPMNSYNQQQQQPQITQQQQQPQQQPGSYSNLPVAIAPPLPPPTAPRTSSRPNFIDYLSGGCELQMVVAIDFTGSNGDPRKPGTLHYIHQDGQLNDYEKAITAVGSIVARYDMDQKFPVYGFGAKYGGIIRHCFQVGPAAELNGVSGILEGYRNVFRTGLTMSGPTVFAEVIAVAADQARKKQAEAAQFGKQAYHILLILTDGAVTDVQQTKEAITAASDAPLSIIIVGIGNADFQAMQFLDDFLSQPVGGRGRDICQFVPFSKHQFNKQNLTGETLDEVPDQLVDYFYSKGIMPMPPIAGNKLAVEEIEHNEDEDIDLTLQFDGQDGEIRLDNYNGPVYDDTQYDTYFKYTNQPSALPGAPSVPPYNAAGASTTGFNPYPSQQGGGVPTNTGFNPYSSLQQQQQQQQQATFTPPPQPTYNNAPSLQQAAAAPKVFHVQVPPNGHPGMQLQITNPFNGKSHIVTVPDGARPGETFPVAE